MTQRPAKYMFSGENDCGEYNKEHMRWCTDEVASDTDVDQLFAAELAKANKWDCLLLLKYEDKRMTILKEFYAPDSVYL